MTWDDYYKLLLACKAGAHAFTNPVHGGVLLPDRLINNLPYQIIMNSNKF
jgi:hypothetical protein